MAKYTTIILLFLLSACDSRTGNNSKYTIAQGSSYSDRQRIDGRSIFQSYCASCHNPIKDATGPALNKQLIESRTDEWIYTLLAKQKELKKDSAYKARVKEYGLSCTQSNISKQELSALLHYLRHPVPHCNIPSQRATF